MLKQLILECEPEHLASKLNEFLKEGDANKLEFIRIIGFTCVWSERLEFASNSVYATINRFVILYDYEELPLEEIE